VVQTGGLIVLRTSRILTILSIATILTTRTDIHTRQDIPALSGSMPVSGMPLVNSKTHGVCIMLIEVTDNTGNVERIEF